MSIYKEYHSNGKIRAFIVHKDGNKNGDCILYHENGKLLLQTFYRDNKIEGPLKMYYDNGKIMFYKDEDKSVIYHENGEVIEEKDGSSLVDHIYDVVKYHEKF